MNTKQPINTTVFFDEYDLETLLRTDYSPQARLNYWHFILTDNRNAAQRFSFTLTRIVPHREKEGA